MKKLAAGSILANGFTVVVATEDVVLAVQERKNGPEYVVWSYYYSPYSPDEAVITASVDYSGSFFQAAEMFKARAYPTTTRKGEGR